MFGNETLEALAGLVWGGFRGGRILWKNAEADITVLKRGLSYKGFCLRYETTKRKVVSSVDRNCGHRKYKEYM